LRPRRDQLGRVCFCCADPGSRCQAISASPPSSPSSASPRPPRPAC
jgi:hypothetical protein